jgi:glutaconate CoA-transferase subunit B
VGTNSPIPAAAALLARALSDGTTEVAILGSRRHWPFTDGGRELFDFAAQGRLDAFFLGGGQIDGAGNVNLVRIGDTVRFPGSFGSAYLFALVPNIVLFREEHSPRVLVPRVDFVSARGSGPEGTYRRGGPRRLVTGRAVFGFDGAFTLESVHPGETAESVRDATGFAFAAPDHIPTTPPPTADELRALRGIVAGELAETYPRFCAEHLRTS